MKTLTRGLLLASFLFLQCTNNPTANKDDDPVDPASLGKVSMDMDMTGAPEDVSALQGYLVSAANDTQQFIFRIDGNTARALVENLSPGNWLVIVDALNAQQQVIYSGSTTVQVQTGIITPVALQLNPVTGGLSIRVTWGEQALSDSLVICYYPFEGDFNDLSSYQNNGTGYGGVGFDEGIRGKCLRFDGLDDYVEIPDGDQFDIEDKTITFWFFKANDSIQVTPGWWDVEGLIYKSWDSGLNRDFSFNLSMQDPPFTIVSNVWNGSDTLIFMKNSKIIYPQQWYMLTMVIENKTAKLYINSYLAVETPFEGDLQHNDAPVSIGKLAYYSAPTRFLNGKIDEFAIIAKPLSATEISRLYNNGVNKLFDLQ